MAPPAPKTTPERWLERGLFASRWLMAPIYVGLVLALAALTVVFVEELAGDLPALIREPRADHAIVMALSLIDLSLAGNLVLIIVFSGYENFVSKIDVAAHLDRPQWMGTLDFTGLKMKVIASIITISAVALLRAFMALAEADGAPEPAKLSWLIGLHLTFVLTGVLMAVMDWLGQKSGH